MYSLNECTMVWYMNIAVSSWRDMIIRKYIAHFQNTCIHSFAEITLFKYVDLSSFELQI